MLKNRLCGKKRIETSKNHRGPFCDDKTRMISQRSPSSTLSIWPRVNDYRSGAFLQERLKTSLCHFNLHNTRRGMTSYGGHSHLP